MLLTVILSGSLILTPLEYVHSLPLGELVLRVDQMENLPQGSLGGVAHRNPRVINLRKGLTDNEEVKDLLAHELCHVIDHAHRRPSQKYPFGRGVFVSQYAKTSKAEDWADSCMYVIRGIPFPKGAEKKEAAVRAVLFPS